MVREAVLRATLTELVESGYAGLSFDRVATRAGVHRTTVYRRWGNREDLVADALLTQAAQDVLIPDTGSLNGDLSLLLGAIVANLTSPLGGGLVRALVSEAAQSPGIAVAGRKFWSTRFSGVAVVLRRAAERGELPDGVDTDLFIEALVAPVFFRLLVTGQPVPQDYVQRLIHWVISATANTNITPA